MLILFFVNRKFMKEQILGNVPLPAPLLNYYHFQIFTFSFKNERHANSFFCHVKLYISVFLPINPKNTHFSPCKRRRSLNFIGNKQFSSVSQQKNIHLIFKILLIHFFSSVIFLFFSIFEYFRTFFLIFVFHWPILHIFFFYKNHITHEKSESLREKTSIFD